MESLGYPVNFNVIEDEDYLSSEEFNSFLKTSIEEMRAIKKRAIEQGNRLKKLSCKCDNDF